MTFHVLIVHGCISRGNFGYFRVEFQNGVTPSWSWVFYSNFFLWTTNFVNFHLIITLTFIISQVDFWVKSWKIDFLNYVLCQVLQKVDVHIRWKRKKFWTKLLIAIFDFFCCSWVINRKLLKIALLFAKYHKSINY